jgi:arylsulfatase
MSYWSYGPQHKKVDTIMENSLTRRQFLQAAGATAAGLALSQSGLVSAEPASGQDRPNILWICTDQQRYDTIACHGNKYIRTPNIDRLASEGTAFTHAFCQAPVCTPSRSSFLTGRYPSTTRAHDNGQCIPPDEVLVTKMLADAGYDCGLSGKLHISACSGRVEKRIADGYREFHWSHDPSPQWGNNSEYTKWLASKGYKWSDLYHPKGYAFAGIPAELHQTTWCTDKAIDFIKEDRKGPWLMSVNIYAPHTPFDPPKEYLDRYDPDKLPDPAYTDGELDDKPAFQRFDHDGSNGGRPPFSKMTPRERREIKAAYYAMIEHVDDNVGRILKMLDDTGQRKNTIIIFMSDHGELLGDHGIFLKGPYTYDCSVRVPLIISWPGHFKSGVKSDALVELLDIAPTLLTAAGMPIPNRVQGRPLTDLLTGKTDKHRDQVFCESYGLKVGTSQPTWTVSMVRTRTHKIAVCHGTDQGELYDLQADPGEHKNLYHSPAHAGLKAEMMKLCFDTSVATMDPVPVRVAPW